MDSQAKDIISSDVVDELDGNTGFQEALDRVLKSNPSLSKSESWTKPTREQKKQMRDRITSDRRTNTKSIKKRGKEDVKYVQVDEGNFKKVLNSDEYVYNPANDRYYLQDSNGDFKEVIEKK